MERDGPSYLVSWCQGNSYSHRFQKLYIFTSAKADMENGLYHICNEGITMTKSYIFRYLKVHAYGFMPNNNYKIKQQIFAYGFMPKITISEK